MSMATQGSEDTGNCERAKDAVDSSDHNVEEEARRRNNVDNVAPPLESLTSSNEEPETQSALNEVASRVSVKLNSEDKETKGEPSSTTRDDAGMTSTESSSSPPTLSAKNASGSDQQATTKEGPAKVPDATTPENDSKNDRTTSATTLISADVLDDDLKGKASCNFEQESTSSAIDRNNSAEEGNAQETGRLPLTADAGSPPNVVAIENEPTSSTSTGVPIAIKQRKSHRHRQSTRLKTNRHRRPRSRTPSSKKRETRHRHTTETPLPK
mmetsp:Transcript_23298/g.41703  ORF Transcript_23298/g.41703 Transcript_23298/m.41703 type:complete len:269 (-) Transcript_23298:477-1283(-)